MLSNALLIHTKKHPFFVCWALLLVVFTLSFKAIAEIKPALSASSISLSTTDYQRILEQTNKQMLWFHGGELTLSGHSLHWLFADLGWHDLTQIRGLSADHYRRHDQLLTAGFLALINQQRQKSASLLPAAPSLLISAINSATTEQLLGSLLPQYDPFSQLRQVISGYRLLSVSPWPKLDADFKPKLGQSHPQVKNLRDILVRLGYLAKKTQVKYRLDVFDSVAVAALKKFQQRHGLAADGKLNAETLQALQVPPQQRIKQLQANLWRWFSLPAAPEKYLLVNIPSYQLAIIDSGRQVLRMKVIVGDSDNPTPQLITQITQITLNPSWTPTLNIINNELIPAYQKDFLSLQRQHFSLVKGAWHNVQHQAIDQPNLNFSKLLQTYRLVQAPGSDNALGYYRFNIPSDHAIYLHDTPIKSLFKQPLRALSHGCIRLENAHLLAQYLLSDERLRRQNAMASALKSGKTTALRLTQPMPVYITYQTAWFDSRGELNLSADIYLLDD